MNSTYSSTNVVRTVTAIALAVLLSATCVMGAVAPAAMQSAQTASMVTEVPVA